MLILAIDLGKRGNGVSANVETGNVETGTHLITETRYVPVSSPAPATGYTARRLIYRNNVHQSRNAE
jgi:hypothetical protein